MKLEPPCPWLLGSITIHLQVKAPHYTLSYSVATLQCLATQCCWNKRFTAVFLLTLWKHPASRLVWHLPKVWECNCRKHCRSSAATSHHPFFQLCSGESCDKVLCFMPHFVQTNIVELVWLVTLYCSSTVTEYIPNLYLELTGLTVCHKMTS